MLIFYGFFFFFRTFVVDQFDNIPFLFLVKINYSFQLRMLYSLFTRYYPQIWLISQINHDPIIISDIFFNYTRNHSA